MKFASSVQIVVCSGSAIKLGATRVAAGSLGVHGDPESASADSGVPAQPYGDLQTLTGAQNRAAGVAGDPAHRGRFVVAVENGVAPRGAGFVGLAYVVVVTPSGRVVVRASEEVPAPAELVEQAEKSGWTVTVGKLEAARTPDCRHDDPDVVWSGGKVTRRMLLTEAIGAALQAAFRAEGVL